MLSYLFFSATNCAQMQQANEWYKQSCANYDYVIHQPVQLCPLFTWYCIHELLPVLSKVEGK